MTLKGMMTAVSRANPDSNTTSSFATGELAASRSSGSTLRRSARRKEGESAAHRRPTTTRRGRRVRAAGGEASGGAKRPPVLDKETAEALALFNVYMKADSERRKHEQKGAAS